MAIRLSTTQTQKQVLAPSMQQSIEILLLPLLDLQGAIEQELETNPLLEINEERLNDKPNLEDAELREKIERLIEIPDLPEHGYYIEDELIESRPIQKEDTLEDTLLQQLRIEFTDPLDLSIGEMIIGNIDDDGYLTITCQEVADALNITDPQRIERVLTTIHSFEPYGIGARDLKECLLAQAQENSSPYSGLTCQIIQDHLEDLSKKKYQRILKALCVSMDELQHARQLISSLDPKPARNFRAVNTNIYIKPDIFITQSNDNQYHIFVNEEGVPPLKINRIYKSMLKRHSLSLEEETFIREKLRNALLFIRSIEQRGQTIRSIANYILDKQKQFFENGHMSLVPMSLKDVATSIGRNESTISRAINNKYIETPRGLFPLKYFFSQAVGSIEGDHNSSAQAVSNRSIKEEIKHLIEEENPSSPLSDQDIQKFLADRGLKIARRTISKYRQSLNILPSHLRKH